MNLSKAFDTIKSKMLSKPFTIWNSDIKEQKSRKFLVQRVKSPRILFLDHFSLILFKWPFFFADICNFGVDTTFHTCDFSLESLVKRLEHGANLAVEWFDINYMKLKPFTIWNRYQRTKIKNVFVSKNEILLWAPQDSVLRPLLFHII